MAHLTLASRTAGRLELERAESPYGHKLAWEARVNGPGLSASLVFPEEGWATESLSGFFDRLNEASSAIWQGELEWKAEEDEFRLIATHALTNTVILRVRLRSADSWTAELALETDPGVYDEAARLMRELSGP